MHPHCPGRGWGPSCGGSRSAGAGWALPRAWARTSCRENRACRDGRRACGSRVETRGERARLRASRFGEVSPKPWRRRTCEFVQAWGRTVRHLDASVKQKLATDRGRCAGRPDGRALRQTEITNMAFVEYRPPGRPVAGGCSRISASLFILTGFGVGRICPSTLNARELVAGRTCFMRNGKTAAVSGHARPRRPPRRAPTRGGGRRARRPPGPTGVRN